MDHKKLADDLYVSGQITIDDIQKLAANGVRSIICNRPDHEGVDQPRFDEIKIAATAFGIETHYLPIVPGQLSDADVVNFGTALTTLTGPTLAFCKSGARAVTLWSFSQSQSMPVADILASTKAAGYDMSGIEHRIANGGKTPAN